MSAVSFKAVFERSICEAVTSFGDHISHVVLMTADEQMIGIYAARNIAAVKNVNAEWSEFPNHERETMSRNGYSEGSRSAVIEVPISIFVDSPIP